MQNGKRLFEFAGQYSTANPDIGLFLNSGRIPDFYGNTHSFGLKDVSGIKQYVHFKSNGFIEAIPGKGYFVKKKSEEFRKEEIYTKIEEKLSEAINLADTYNIDYKEIAEMLDTLLKEE